MIQPQAGKRTTIESNPDPPHLEMMDTTQPPAAVTAPALLEPHFIGAVAIPGSSSTASALGTGAVSAASGGPLGPVHYQPQPVTTDFLLKSLKENTEFILKSFNAHMGALSQRVDVNADNIAGNARAIDANKSRAEENEDNIWKLTARVRSLEHAPHQPSAPATTRATLSQEYLFARRSIRLWPISGGTDAVLWEGVGDFVHDALCVSTTDIGQDDIKSVSRVIYTASGGQDRLEVLVTFFDRNKRDLVVTHATNLSGRVDSEGRPTAGIRLEIPRQLDDTFRLLSRFGTRLRARHGVGTKRHIKFNDFAGSLYTNVKLPGDTSWTRVSPETAREDLLAWVREEALFTRKRLASKLVPGPRERLARPPPSLAAGPARTLGQASTSSATTMAGRRPRWSRPDRLPPA